MPVRFSRNPFLSSILLASLLLTGCSTIRSIFHPSDMTKTTTEDFDTFYDRFHADEAFQRSRVRWPLQGMTIEDGDEIPWTRDNFPIMKVRIYDIDTSEYKTEYKKEPSRFTQRVWLEDSEFSSEFHFELIEGKWYLVYVLDES
ncbi:MAG: hypothetical protein R2787_07890 [Saprospiraceae bacterium]